jgi:membrane protein DedA with SNARE-associated domain
MFARYGAPAVFFARFVFGLRVFAGPLAGVLRMRWRAFALFNFLGAALWVTCIASAGYLFGQHWRTLARAMQRFNIAVLIVAVVVILFLWWRYRRQRPSKNV